MQKLALIILIAIPLYNSCMESESALNEFTKFKDVPEGPRCGIIEQTILLLAQDCMNSTDPNNIEQFFDHITNLSSPDKEFNKVIRKYMPNIKEAKKLVSYYKKKKESTTLLEIARMLGWIDLFKLILDNIKVSQEEKNELLIRAVGHNLEMVKYLIKHRADINAISENKIEAPLLNAIYGDNSSMVKFLLNQPKINVNIQNKVGNSALELAASQGKKDIVEWLLKKGANKNLLDISGNTALDLAILAMNNKKNSAENTGDYAEIIELLKK